MITIIIISALCWILYKSGVVSRFLELFTLSEVEPIQAQPPAPDPFRDTTRLELERLAAEKMKALKIKHWYYITRVATNDVLLEFLRE